MVSAKVEEKMGKKGKKEKVSANPEVAAFMATKEFGCLKESINIQESLPFVASDILDDQSLRKVAKFLNMLGILAEFSKAEKSKEYRFQMHHRLVAPLPQFFPKGYPASLIKIAL